ncbi:MAG: hypothetical protein HZA16_14700 [Nitrospirae bacterium]|nr:hypothetical protein [Nitrospirota bacterium]
MRSLQGRWMMDFGTFNRKIGFLRAGWWIVHLLGIATVYALGNLLWR